MQCRFGADAGEFPRGDVAVSLVVAKRLAVGRLEFLAEMPAAGFVALERIQRQQLAELHVIGDPACVVEHGIEVVLLARDRYVLPELVAQRANLPQRFLQPGRVSGHADVVPHDAAELPVELADGSLAFDPQHPVDPVLRVDRGLVEGVVVGRHLRQLRTREVVGDGVGRDEIAVRQALHQRAGAETVRAVIGEVRLAQHEQARNRALEVVVHP